MPGRNTRSKGILPGNAGSPSGSKAGSRNSSFKWIVVRYVASSLLILYPFLFHHCSVVCTVQDIQKVRILEDLIIVVVSRIC